MEQADNGQERPASAQKTGRTRAEFIRWCKQRAVEALEYGTPRSGINSIMSDLRKGDLPAEEVEMLSMLCLMESLQAGTKESVRRFIEGFNE